MKMDVTSDIPQEFLDVLNEIEDLNPTYGCINPECENFGKVVPLIGDAEEQLCIKCKQPISKI